MSDIITDEMVRDASTAALVSIARMGVPPDVSELLVRGNGRGSVVPGAIGSAVFAALVTAIPAIIEACAKVVDDNVEAVELKSGKRGLIPRDYGNLVATAYATAIRKFKG